MDNRRMQELGGVITEAVNPMKKYPVVVAEYTPKQVFAELKDIVDEMVGDEELPEGTKLSIDMLDDAAMNVFIDGVEYMYDEGGSDDKRADNYYGAMEKTIKHIFKKK